MLCDLTQHDHCENVGITVRPRRYTNCIQAFLEAYRKIEDWTSHDQLREDLIESMAINWEIVRLYFFKIHLFLLEQFASLDYLLHSDYLLI